jgi:hypothetical protein
LTQPARQAPAASGRELIWKKPAFLAQLGLLHGLVVSRGRSG